MFFHRIIVFIHRPDIDRHRPLETRYGPAQTGSRLVTVQASWRRSGAGLNRLVPVGASLGRLVPVPVGPGAARHRPVSVPRRDRKKSCIYSEYFRIFGRGFRLFIFIIFRKMSSDYSEYSEKFRIFGIIGAYFSKNNKNE